MADAARTAALYAAVVLVLLCAVALPSAA
ncbi:3'-nucleotidase/nuclease, putative [Leishmania donovani]|uniref:3'-nucleotidase/nuclease, putative n=1 Tax=Leishmania donovani TaxID=5661 RepID=E9BN08_LEIDO|nr:3'-nucleotidase/nuclease, putative [Leishmania donovani]CBZ36636.1 3'-nucleotidase/nuclease, putative [Leishmania donovani]